MGGICKRELAQRTWGILYISVIVVLFPVAVISSLFQRFRTRSRSVVHIGELRHIQHQFVEELRNAGIDATYVSVGDNPHWNKADVKLPHLANPVAAALRDLLCLVTVVARHEVVHSHCMMGISHYQWELLVLRLVGRRIVAHIRGCEGRSPQAFDNPSINICANCDYWPKPLCLYRENRRRRWIFGLLANQILVTTPDLMDFWPSATHVRFFLPAHSEGGDPRQTWTPATGQPLRIVHVTNQPGIEGTDTIRGVVSQLVDKGNPLQFTHLSNVSHAQVMQAYANADLAIGKMKMGYYANAQIESMLLGIPTITWIRPDLLTQDVEDAGFILSSLDDLEAVLKRILSNPDILARAAARSQAGIRALHDASPIIDQLERLYGWR